MPDIGTASGFPEPGTCLRLCVVSGLVLGASFTRHPRTFIVVLCVAPVVHSSAIRGPPKRAA